VHGSGTAGLLKLSGGQLLVSDLIPHSQLQSVGILPHIHQLFALSLLNILTQLKTSKSIVYRRYTHFIDAV
jgi:hypothetical protein